MRGYVVDQAGNVNKTVLRNFTIDLTYPNYTWVSPTPAIGNIRAYNSSYLNLSVGDSYNTSAFFDWNKSLIAYYSFENVDTLLRDDSSFANNGTLYNLTSNNSAEGKFGRGFEFSGNETGIS